MIWQELLTEAVTLHQQGQWRAAQEKYGKALAQKEDHPQAHNNLAALLWHLHETDAGLFHAQRAIQLQPDFALAYMNCGLLLMQKGKLQDAQVFLSKSVKLAPQNADAHCNLGVLWRECGDLPKALKSFQNALMQNPRHMSSFLEIGNTYKAAGQYTDAVAAYKAALQLQPDNFQILNNLGTALQDLDHYDAAKVCYENVLRLKPDCAIALCNLAQAQEEEGDFTQALQTLQKTLSLEPQNIDAHLTKSALHFKRGEYIAAWEEAEWRFKKPAYSYLRYYTQPFWQGQDLKGKTLLVHAEQGLGDELVFYSCLSVVISRAKKVVVECDPRLVGLLQNSFPTARILPRPKDNIRHSLAVSDSSIDYQIPSGSLQLFFRRTEKDFPTPGGFLKSESSFQEKWRERLRSVGPGLKVGIAWTSSLTGALVDGARRGKGSTFLNQWRDLLLQEGIQFINLQYGDVSAEMKACQEKFPFVLHQWEDLDLKNDLSDIAALVSELDLVISINSAVSLLSAALGKTAWTLCDFANGNHLPLEAPDVLLPDRVLIRQESAGQWNDVFARVLQKLKTL